MACRSCIDHDQGQSWYLALELPHIAQCPGEVGQNIFSSGVQIGQLSALPGLGGGLFSVAKTIPYEEQGKLFR